jgi:hypothetical protein
MRLLSGRELAARPPIGLGTEEQPHECQQRRRTQRRRWAPMTTIPTQRRGWDRNDEANHPAATTAPPVNGLRIFEPGNPSRARVRSWVSTSHQQTKQGGHHASVVNNAGGNRMPAQRTLRRTTTRPARRRLTNTRANDGDQPRFPLYEHEPNEGLAILQSRGRAKRENEAGPGGSAPAVKLHLLY